MTGAAVLSGAGLPEASHARRSSVAYAFTNPGLRKGGRGASNIFVGLAESCWAPDMAGHRQSATQKSKILETFGI